MRHLKLPSRVIFEKSLPVVGWGMLVAVLNAVCEVQSAELCTPAMALVVSVQGVVEFRRVAERNWQPAFLNSELCPGDMVRVRRHSRAALRLSNDTMLRLDQKSALTLKGTDDDKATLLEMFAGRLHVLTRTPKPFKVKTPFLNAGVEGTEFFVGLKPDEARVVIYEGKVSASNEYGNLMLTDNEAAIVLRNQAPRKEAIVRPIDAVQWALHYPAIIDDRLGEKAGKTLDSPALQAAIEHHRHGRLAEALASLDDTSRSDSSAFLLTYRAGLLLAVGRVDEASADIKQALALESGDSDAYALQAIIAVAQNDKEQAMVLGNRAVETNPALATARLALSYVQQAHFRIEDAIESVKKAIDLDPANALAWARLAELHLSTGYLDRALEAAHRAVDLNPNLAKTRVVLGFSYLAQIDTEAAKAAFSRAIELDQSDPMPRLGMGLAMIREGDLEAGRIELEIAASLDPANSLIRSYLGKAYFEEKRYELAATQFDLAKERDPNDPTPWLYDGIMKQTQNQPVEALREIQRSIELNDNRAVYRSKLLLDQDQAARGSSLARIYDNLGFERRAIMETTKSLTQDPSNHSAHRFLSDAYLNIPRHEIARVSELLQAQLLQPVNVNPVQPQLAVADLNIITGTGPTRTGFNEFAPLMERNKPQFVGSGIFGSNNTLGNEAVLSALYGRASVSVGQFHYHTDGFRPNNDQKHNVYNAFIQYAVTPKFNVQAEVRTRKTENGDLLMNFDLARFNKTLRQEFEQDTARLGARYSLSPRQDVITSVMYFDGAAQERKSGKSRPFDDDRFPQTSQREEEVTTIKSQGYQAEAQYMFKDSRFNVTTGGGTYRIESNTGGQTTTAYLPALPGLTPCDIEEYTPCTEAAKPAPLISERTNGYIYSNLRLPQNLTLTLGLSYDSYKDMPVLLSATNPVSGGRLTFNKFNKFNPKFGMQWDIINGLRLRLAWFESVKSALIANQTIEPTQVAGFNQLFDDLNGTRAQRMGIGLDAYASKTLYSGFEISARHLEAPIFEADFSLAATQKQKETLYRAYLYWLPHPHWSIRIEPQLEKFSRPAIDAGQNPSRIETLSVPLSFSYFHPRGIFSRFSSTYVRQELERGTTAGIRTLENLGDSDFLVIDTAVGYRLPNRRGIISLEGRNLLNQDYSFRNLNFQQSLPFYNQRFTPGRNFFIRLTLNF